MHGSCSLYDLLDITFSIIIPHTDRARLYLARMPFMLV